MEFITQDAQHLQKVQDTPDFDNLGVVLIQEILSKFASRLDGARKRSREDGLEFPDGTDWTRLSVSQLRRACLERDLPDAGSKSQLLSVLGSSMASVRQQG